MPRGQALIGVATRWGVAASLLVLAAGVPLMWVTGSYGFAGIAQEMLTRRTAFEIGLLFGLAVAFALPWVIARWWYTVRLPAWVPPVGYLLVSVGPVVAVLAGAKEFGNWLYTDMLRFFHMSPIFADLLNVTFAWECGLQKAGTVACDLWGRPYIYPSALLWLGNLGIDSRFTVVLGLALATGIALSLWYLSSKSTTAGRVSLILIGISPTAALITERANIEALLLPALLSAIWVGGKRLTPALFSFIIISLAALTKFLPAIALVAVPFASPKQKVLRMTIGLSCLIIVALILIPDLQSARSPAGLATSFGLPNLLALISGGDAPTFGVPGLAWFLVLLAGLIGVLTGVAWRFSTNFKVDGRFSPERAIALAGLSVIGVAFIGFSSFDYRLILLALVVPLLNQLLIGETRFSVNARLAAACLGLLALAPLSLPVPLITSAVVLVLLSVVSGWFITDFGHQIVKRNRPTARFVAQDKS